MIKAFENVFDDHQRDEIQNYLRSSSWRYGHTSKSGDDNRKFWIMNLNDCDFFSKHLFECVKHLTQMNADLLHVYANGQTYGQSGSWHLDSTETDEYTFLFYANSQWNVSWGGETVFNMNNTLHHFIPKPNAGLLFPANVWHYAKSPAREFFDLRTTIAFKMKLTM